MFSSYKKKTAVILVIAVFFIALDRALKVLSVERFFYHPVNLIGGFLRFNFAGNYNIAFSLPLGGQFLVWLILVIIFGLVYNAIFLYKRKDFLQAGLAIVIVLGAISNWIDRIEYGFVVDYLDLKYFTIFNIADALIVFGVFSLIYLYFVNNRK